MVRMDEGKTNFKVFFSLPGEPAARRITFLVLLTCAAIAAGAAALILTWMVSGDLEAATVAAAVVLALILAGLAGMSLRGKGRVALVLLCGLLFLLVAADLYAYGLHSSMASAFLIPIVLAARGFGLRAGIGAAAACSLFSWLLAAGANAPWLAAPYPADISHLTFDAPALTVVFLICAVIAGYGADGRRRGADSEITGKEGT
ncbi:MAG: hypothetical protein JW929_02895 [Anaerolineales bacterium]|nr:hypothetical protein [Anaerolineales bacterium]